MTNQPLSNVGDGGVRVGAGRTSIYGLEAAMHLGETSSHRRF
jgi:hypothetical protein